MQTLSRLVPDEAETLAVGQAIGQLLAKQPVAHARLHVNLVGELGAGKTTLVRGVLRGLGYAGRVKSPTYPLLETYRLGDLNLAHFDLYRLESPEAFLETGFEEYFAGPGIRFVEWPKCAGMYLPLADWCLNLIELPEGGRQMSINALSDEGKALLERLNI